MWWTNWTTDKPFTPDELRDTSDVKSHTLELFKDRQLMYPCIELINSSFIYLKNSVYDIQTLPTWHKSRICLIGDAAHAVLPLPLFNPQLPR